MSNRVKPILRLAVLCELIEADRDNRPFVFVPVHTIRFPDGVRQNYRPPSLHVYLQLEDAVGTFLIGAVLREETTSTELFRASPVEIPFDGTEHRNIPLELDLELDGLIFPKPGVYEVSIYANHVCLHEAQHQPRPPFAPLRVNVWPPEDDEGGVL